MAVAWASPVQVCDVCGAIASKQRVCSDVLMVLLQVLAMAL